MLKKDEDLRYFIVGIKAFNGFGIDIRAAENQQILNKPIRLCTIWLFSTVVSVMMIAFAINHRDNIDKVASGLWLFVPCLLAGIKCLIFLFRGRNYIRLMQDFQVLAKEGNQQEIKMWKEELKLLETVTKIYTACCCSGVSFLIGVPIFETLSKYLKTKELVFEPPFAGIFPYDLQNPINYALTYIMYLFFLLSITFGCLNVDCLFFYFIQNICACYRILYYKWKNAAQQIEHEGTRNDFHIKLINAVNFHRNLIRLSAKFNNLYSSILLLEVILSCFQICMFQYKLSKQEPEQLTAALGLVICSFQLMIYCLGGQKIENQSEVLPINMFILFPWHRMTAKDSRLVMFALIRSQVVRNATGYFFIVNSNLLVSVFRMSFSITTLLKALNE